MKSEDIRTLWLEDMPGVQAIPEEMLPRTLQGKGVNLVIHELNADEAGTITEACTLKNGKTDQKKFMALMLIKCVRNADDADNAVWDMPFLDRLLKARFKPMLDIAKAAIELSGLNDQVAEKNV